MKHLSGLVMIIYLFLAFLYCILAFKHPSFPSLLLLETIFTRLSRFAVLELNFLIVDFVVEPLAGTMIFLDAVSYFCQR